MEKELYGLSFPQKSIWLTEQYHSNTCINNICGILTINNTINKELLEKAILIFIKSNDAVKLTLNLTTEEPKQYISTKSISNLKYIKINSENELKTITKRFSQESFNLNNSFLFDFLIFKFKNNSKGGFIAKLHHLISDAWSMTLLIDEVIDIYSNLLKNISFQLKKPSYITYINKEKDYLLSEKYIKDKIFWENLFNTTPEITSLSNNIENTIDITTTAIRKTFTLSSSNTDKIKNFCKENKTSPYVFFMSILGLYSAKLNNTNTVILGTPILNRSNFIEKNTIGMYISTIPFKIIINYKDNFKDYISNINKEQISYFRHHKYPYENLLNNIREKYNISKNLYTTVLSYHNAKDNRRTSNISYNTDWIFNGNISEELEIHISDLDDNNTFNFIFDYNIKKFTEQDINNMYNRLSYVTKQIINNSNILLKDIEITTPEEKNILLTKFNNTYTEYPQDKNIVEIFYDNVIKYSNHTALIYDNEKITYKELYKKVSAIEKQLIKNNVQFQDIIAVYMPKSIEYVASILAILKLGAIYLPVSVDYPEERIKYMFENSKTKLIICKNKTKNKFNINMIFAKEIDYKNEEITVPEHFDISNSAYIIYTSGSTGKPKGVEVSQKSIINHVYGISSRFNNDFSIKDNTLSIANISFDANIQEIFIPIFFGCTLHLVSEDSIYDPSKIANYIHNNKITFTFIPPTILNSVYINLKNYTNISLNKLLVGVQTIKNTTLNNYLKLIPNLKIHNGYGPTEATICCISKMYNEIIENKTFNIPIGKPMDNCQAFLLNNTLTLQPLGYVGEICIAGECLAKGYLYNKEKTESSFIFCNSINKNIYRTGDYGYYLPNGDIMYKGRIDMQVKLNGYRIELSEIDKVISKYFKDLEYSHSLIYNNKIYTFIIAKNINNIELKQYLKTKLPYYMIPIKFINIEKIPSTQNGKINKDYLINILEEHLKNNQKEIVLSSNNIEEYLIQTLSQLLKIPINNISIKDNFFELGGDSLSAIKICTSLQKDLNLTLPIKKIFELDTIEDISNYLLSNSTSNYYNIEKYTKTLDKYPVSSAQKRIYLSCLMANNQKLLYNMPGIIKLPNDINIKRLENSLNKLIEKHESLRTFFITDSTGIYQKILPKAKLPLNIVSLKDSDFNKYINDFPKKFDLSKAPLIRYELVIKENSEKYLLIDIHHIIFDGISATILAQDLTKLYNNKEINNNQITYKDYSIWENEAIKNNLFKKKKEYWIKKLQNIETLNLPIDYNRSNMKSYIGSTYTNNIDSELQNKIHLFCNNNKITPYMFMLGAFNILMYQYCKQNIITIGTPVSNRIINKTTDIIGMFVNTLVITTKVEPNINITEYYLKLKNNITNDFKNQIYPFDKLTSDIKTKKSINNNILFNTMFIFQNTGTPKIIFNKYETSIKPIYTNISKFDLSIEIVPKDNEYNITFEYCTKLFNLSTIKSLYKSYLYILNYIVNNKDILVKDIFLKTNNKNYKSKNLVSTEQIKKSSNNITTNTEIKSITFTEQLILEIYKTILNKQDINIEDNFFEIGGDSLSAMQIVLSLLNKGIKIEYSDMFIYSSIKELANKIDTTSSNIKKENTTISIQEKNKYLSYNSFLQNNTIENIKDINYESLDNILLTGVTGFLGAHILDSFLKKERGVIYCLIRDKKTLPAIQRLKEILNFYFEKKYDHYIGNRIQVIKGDISKKNLGLSIETYKFLGKTIKTVIHSAANVKHYGLTKEFEQTNILGTQNLVNLCTDLNLKLIHISTLSISGNIGLESTNTKNNFTNNIIFNEKNFYIGQDISNIYINSKFKSEDIILDAISKGLNAYILRIGNLTSRLSDGKFQQNYFENAFVNRLKTFLQIRVLPDYLLKGYLEFTPVDSCSDAIINLATHYDRKYSVFHLFNDNHVSMSKLCNELNKLGIYIKIVSSEKFKNIINTFLQDENKKEYLQGIINDFNEKQELIYESNIKIQSDFTKKFLEKINFKWPNINTKYLKNYFKYLSNIGYFNIEIK